MIERLPEPIVILGGGGFIGSNLAKRLYEDGYEVQLVDVEYHDWRWPLNGDNALYERMRESQFIYDLCWYNHAVAAVEGAGTVFHLAADMGGVEYFHSDKDFGAAIDNQLMTTNVVKACVAEGVQRLIYASSACAADTEEQYQDGHAFPVRERHIKTGDPDARYGAEKRHGAYVVANAPLDGRVAMFHTVYGPGQEHEGVRMKFPSAVATGALRSLETGELTLFGNGEQLRSYLYVDDAIDRLIALASVDRAVLDTYEDWAYGGWLRYVFNIGSRTAVSCRSVAETCLRLVGSDAVIKYNDAKPSGVLGRTANLSKWERVFGPATETSVETGFQKFLDWLKGTV